MSGWLERYEALKAQAEDLASTAQAEVDARKATATGGSNGASTTTSASQNLNARRKIMEMGRVITSMDKLANDNMDPEDEQTRIRVQSDIGDLQRQQRQVLAAARNPQGGSGAFGALAKPLRAEETTKTRQHDDQELMSAQYEGLAQQDAQLDRVEAAVGRVHDQASAMRGEVGTQNRLLDSLDQNVLGVRHRVGRATDRVADALARMPRKLYYLTCFLVPFLFTLLLMLLLKSL